MLQAGFSLLSYLAYNNNNNNNVILSKYGIVFYVSPS